MSQTTITPVARPRQAETQQGQDQQDQDRSVWSAGRSPQGSGGKPRTPARSGSSGRIPSNGSSHPRGCIDTILLTRRLYDGEPFDPVGTWESISRKHPGTNRKETWQQLDQSYNLGWRIEYQPERRVIQIRLSIPKTMARKDVNYPLRPLYVERLSLAAYMIGQVTGMHPRELNWESMAVREVAFTADLVVQDKYADHKEGIIRAVANLPHAGKWFAQDTSVRWRSGDRDVQVYAKGDELRHHLGRKAFEALAKEHPQVSRVVRLEVTLRTSEIRALFGLPTGWLPMLRLVTPDVAAYVLVTEVRTHFRLHRDLARATKEMDTIAGLAGSLRSAAKARGENLSFSTLAQLVFTNRVLAVHKSSKKVAALFGVTSGHVNKLKRKSIDLGFPPGVSAESYNHACIAEFRRMFLEQYPGRPRKPVLSHRQLHEMTVDAPWVDADDTTRELPGMSVEEYVPKPLPLDAPGIGFGVAAHQQIETAP